MSPVQPGEGEFINCLRLSDAEAAEILAHLKNASGRAGSKERRKQDRISYEHHAGVIVKMHHPGGSIENYLVRVRNLSTGGIGFLHGSFVYSGTRCTIALRARDNRVVWIEGKVVRCQHVQKHVHEIGIQFDVPIRLGEFVASALRMGAEVETSKELPQLSGQVLYVEDSVSDQELMAFHLGNVGVKVKAVSNVLAALELVGQTKFDAVLANVWLPAMSGLELADFLRQNGYTGPVIALTADDRPEVRAEAQQHGCTDVIIKPYHFEELLTVLEPHLPRARGVGANGVLMSEQWGNERMQPLIRSFLKQLKDKVAEMERLATAGKGGLAVRKICLDAKGSAGGYGFPTISQSAQVVLELLAKETQGEPLKSALLDLAGLCQAACALLDVEAAAPAAAPTDAPVPPVAPGDTKAA